MKFHSKWRAPARITDPEIVGIALALLRALGEDQQGVVHASAIRAFAAAQLDGWSAPVGYAMAREADFGFWSKSLATSRGWYDCAPADEAQLAQSAEQAGELLELIESAARTISSPQGRQRLRRIAAMILRWQDYSQKLVKTLDELSGHRPG